MLTVLLITINLHSLFITTSLHEGDKSGSDQGGRGRCVADSVRGQRWKFAGKISDQDQEKAHIHFTLGVFCIWVRHSKQPNEAGLQGQFKSGNNEL